MDITTVNEQDEICFDNEEINEELELDDDGQVAKIYTEKGDPEIDGLYGKWKRGKLDIQPAFQRYFVWDKLKSSRLIESALLGIPLPLSFTEIVTLLVFFFVANDTVGSNGFWASTSSA